MDVIFQRVLFDTLSVDLGEFQSGCILYDDFCVFSCSNIIFFLTF